MDATGPRSRFFALAVIVVALLPACHDGPTAPGALAARYYRLRSATTPPSSGYAGGYIDAGDLLLNDNGTYYLGVRDGLGAFTSGRWTQTGAALSLVTPDTTLRGIVSDDSVQITGASNPFTFGAPAPVLSFVRATLAANPVDGARYVLQSVDGGTARGDGIVLVDTTGGTSHRYAQLVRYDTLTFSNHVFVRRARAEVDSSFSPTSGSLVGASDYTVYGGVEPITGGLVLRLYAGDGGVSILPQDTLRIEGDVLVRRRVYGFSGVARAERYVRIP